MHSCLINIMTYIETFCREYLTKNPEGKGNVTMSTLFLENLVVKSADQEIPRLL
jgi:hypothetical protein